MLIRTENLKKSYGGKCVVDNLTIELPTGSVVGLLGPNGAGKTTSFYMITGMINPDSGRIFFSDKDITSTPMYRRARLGMGYLPQETSIFRKLSVEENLKAVLEMIGISPDEQKERLETLLEKLKISHIRKRSANKLSGGERRRVEIARALTTNPSFLLLDEPFTGIDPKVKEEIQHIVRKLAEEGIGILITDHNVRETLEIIDTAHIIYDGKILLSGSAGELIADKTARELYLGERFRL